MVAILRLLALHLTLLLALTVTACSCAGGSTTATPSPKPPAVTATPLPSPVQTPEVSPVAPEVTPGDIAGDLPQASPDGESTATPDGAEGPTMMGIDVSKLILELEKLSEVETAVVAAQGGRALVGLNFDAQYQGTLTERIEEMVISTVSSVEEMLTDVAVTADPALIEQIRELTDGTNGKEMTEDQIKQFDELYRRIKPDKSAEDTAQ